VYCVVLKMKKYPSNNIYPWCLIIEYFSEGIGFLVGFGKFM